MCHSIFAVIVLYGTEVPACVSLRSLLHAAAQLSPVALRLKVLVYDNTPDAEYSSQREIRCAPAEPLPAWVSYVRDTRNSGLATAYNLALQMAWSEGYEWLLTLDQDTALPPESLVALLEAMSLVDNRPDVAAVVPLVRAGGRIVSPNYFLAGGWPRFLKSGYTGVPKQPIFAFNSGSLLRTAALRQAGGYSPWFWLDNSDSNIYRQLAKLGKRVYVAGQVELAHDFSMLNMQEKVSPARYRNILLSESAFWDMEMNRFAGFERTLRLGLRTVKHLVRRDDRELRRLTVEALWLRLLHSRRFRIARWARLTAPVIARCGDPESRESRSRVSVCMATYNGERFVREQLDSIVTQLNANDEIVLIDDGSTDATVRLLEQFRNEQAARMGSPKVTLLVHEKNQGVVRTFEETLRVATGDILFLADEDDRWAPNKVGEVLKAFAADPDLQIVSTGLELIDEDGCPHRSSEILRHRRFSPKVITNLMHNQFQGSTLSMRSSVLQHVLPFPAGKLFLHDAWIGLRSILRGCKIRHLDAPLLLYRRHGANASKRYPRARQVQLRLQLVTALLGSAFHKL